MVDSTNIPDWMERAKQDYISAKIILNNDGPNNVAAFLLQQAIEKVLKAYLLLKTGELVKGHSIGTLLGLCIKYDLIFEQYQDDCVTIDDYYIETRYPPDVPFEINKDEVLDAVKIAEELLVIVTDKITSI
jgi:HEPN domain-containing protein